MFSDKDLINRKDKDYSIIPFNTKNVNPIGYDLMIGDLVFSKKNGLIEFDENGDYLIKAYDTVHILTEELIWLSGRVSGTLHSRTSLSFKGFSNISTTVDPHWLGRLFITISNLTQEEIKLNKNKPFCTLNIHKLNTPTESTLHNKNFIINYLTDHIKNQNNLYLKKVQNFIKDDEFEEFKNSLSAKNISELKKLEKSISTDEYISLFNKIKNLVVKFLLLILLFLSILSIFKWNLFKPYFYNLDYDSTLCAAQITLIVTIVLALKK